ncbi:MAG: S41 family peptidase, partial [Bacteroidota bacterium]|nr:S41 family peptidase [Bacteroidota bacterium]
MKRAGYISFFLVLFSLPSILAFKDNRSEDNYFEVSKNLEILASVVKEVNTYYVDEVDASKLMRTGIDAMLRSLDPYTEFYSESEVEDYRFMTTGQYGGIGASIHKREDYILISEPYEGSPAHKAGLRGGDRLIEIDGKPVKGKETEDISKLLKGTPGTKVNLIIQRQGVEGNIEKSFNREEIKIKNVPYYGMLNATTGYIKFTQFRHDAAEEVKQAVLALKKNPELKGIVLDMRGNPGGLLDEAIKVVGLFVDKGQVIVHTKGKMEGSNQEYRTREEPVDTKMPLIVLTNKGSASASEIVAGALQDLDRAIVIGENSFGKGLVQTTRPLPYNSQMKITTSKYYIPSGRCIQSLDYSNKDASGKATKLPDSLRTEYKTKCGRSVYDGNGIQPDIIVEHDEFADVIVSLGRKYLFYDFATWYRANHDTIVSPDAFTLSDAEFQSFIGFLKDKEYEYTT